MAVFKCKMCGGALEIQEGESVTICEYCGTKQTIPRLDNETRANLYDRANHFRRNDEFDKAMDIYNQILNEDPEDAEAYWSIVLCRYGIEYVEDPDTHKQIHTVNRTQFTSVLSDEDYKMALKYGDYGQREIYEAEARAIDEIQKGILEISSKEEPFDVFICYKETDQNGRRTHDSVLANDLYHELTEEGYKVFFSRITLEDKIGIAYEPYIFAALNSAKVMVVLGTQKEYFNAVWVKNEWSRFLALIKNGAKKMLIPAYKGMDPYDLPEEFSNLQAQDMGKLGFMQDLVRGIKKLVGADEREPAKTIVMNAGASSESLLKRVFLFLEDGEWNSAAEYCERVLDQDPENGRAYLGKLMAELHIAKQEDLADCEKPFDDKNNYKKAMRFADEELAASLKGYLWHINDRNENERLDAEYQKAIDMMNKADNEQEYKLAGKLFESIAAYKNASALSQTCYEKAEISRKDSIYAIANENLAKSFPTLQDCEFALKQFESIAGWKDAAEKIDTCRRKIEEIKMQEEERRLEQERNEQKEREKAEEKRLKKSIVIPVLALGLICVIGAFVVGSMKAKDQKASKENHPTKSTDTVNNSNNSGSAAGSRDSWVGGYVRFGSYAQSSDNEKDKVEWLVIAEEDNKLLLLSREVLDCKPYSETDSNTTWEDSDLRQWLNTDFLNEIFDTADQNALVSVNEMYKEGVFIDLKNLDDKIFLLSKADINTYIIDVLGIPNWEKCQATEYAKNKGVKVDDKGYCKWLLRAPVFKNKSIAYVNENGQIALAGKNITSEDCGIRPAVWVDLDKVSVNY